MKFYISYFAQCRNMTAKQICFSTAIWDPKWFHDFRGQDYKYFKDGKLYGLRATCFNSVDSSCRGMPCPSSPKTCKFIKNYNKQLKSLNFQEVTDALIKTANMIAEQIGVADPDIVLLVHEAPDNDCSERHSIVQWFKDNGVQISEWKKAI